MKTERMPIHVRIASTLRLTALSVGLIAGVTCFADENGVVPGLEPGLPSAQWRTDGEAGIAALSELHRSVEDLIAEIRLIRQELGIYDYPPDAEFQGARTPVHVYAKTMEVLFKIARVQHRFGVPAAQLSPIPFKVIDSLDVRDNVNLMIREVAKIKSQMEIDREIEPMPLVAGTSADLLYKRLGDASFLLDGLRGQPLLPDDVYRNATRVLGEIELIAERLDVPLESEIPETGSARRPVDVLRQVQTTIGKLLDLQDKLGMMASTPPNISLVRVTPSQVYDATNAILADAARIRLHLGIDQSVAQGPTPTGKRPEDVFVLVSHINDGLDRIAGRISEELLAQVREQQASLREAEEARQREQDVELTRRAREAEEARRREQEAELARRAREAEEARRREQEAELARRAREAEEARRREQEAELARREREAEEARKGEPERQAEVKRQRQERDALAREQQDSEPPASSQVQVANEPAAIPICRLDLSKVARNLRPRYPTGGRDLGDAVIAVSFTIDESGQIIPDEVIVLRERSSLEMEKHFERFARVALGKVRSWTPRFANPNDPSCIKRQTRSISFRFQFQR